jgi:hypothetical protein
MVETTRYPESVLAETKKGKTEVRSLIDKGRFVRYEYLDPVTGKRTANKAKLVLLGDDKTEEYFIIPMKDGRALMLNAEIKGERMLWDGKKAVGLRGEGESK